MAKEAKYYRGDKVATSSKLWELLDAQQTPAQVKLVEEHYREVDQAFRKSYGFSLKGPYKDESGKFIYAEKVTLV